MTPQQFIAKWQRVTLTERSACQQHFLDLCELLDQPKPAAADPEGTFYTFERGVRKSTEGGGFADVWLRDHFGWEYKGKHKNLVAAYNQLLQYKDDLQNPPLLVVCDMDRFEVHTNFTGTVKAVHAFNLEGLADPKNLDVLRKVFTDPYALKPGQTVEGVTQQAAEMIGQLADGMRQRAIPAQKAAHFLMKVMFCMFAEDIDLLPGKLFTRILQNATKTGGGKHLAQSLRALFEAMSEGGMFGADAIEHFNGGLFADADVLDLTADEARKLRDVARLDWSSLEPSIFGTLFERTLDPAKRSQIGAHYTSRDDIITLLEPVVMQPLRREWAEVKADCDKLTESLGQAKKPAAKRKTLSKSDSPTEQKRNKLLRGFVHRLSHVTVLDPACGSGNFLYVALHLLLDLEKEVVTFAARNSLGLIPQVRPTQLSGIEINPFAQELASVVIWIGYLQWMRHNGFNPPNNPVLEPIESIRRMDAILDLSDPENPKEPEWPKADFIVGNPPFLGTKKLRSELGDEYVERLFAMYSDRIPPFSDLCCYWFEKARHAIEKRRGHRAGLLATQGIRGGLNREVLKRIKSSGGIFFAESDRPWILDGANVHVSMVGFDDGSESVRVLDGHSVDTINANLTSLADISQSAVLNENRGVGWIADVKAGAFDVPLERVLPWLTAPNPHGRPNSDVLRPWVNGLDVVRRDRGFWIVDFPSDMSEADASRYETPFSWTLTHVKPKRDQVKRKSYREYWWLHAEPCDVMRRGVFPLLRYCATITVSKHRLFAWFCSPTLPDHQLVAFARSDDYFLGVLHSRPHEVWARSQGTQVRERESGFRYTPTTCFETFPFPKPTEAQREAIGAAAKELDQLRTNWLNPPEWTRVEVLEFPGSADGPWKRYIDPASVDARGIGTVRYPRTVAKDDECAKELKKRTLTNLYNQRPTWLDLAHRKLDAAVFAAYGWDPATSDDDLLAILLALNLKRSAAP